MRTSCQWYSPEPCRLEGKRRSCSVVILGFCPRVTPCDLHVISASLIVDKTAIFMYFLFGNINADTHFIQTSALRTKCHTRPTETINKVQATRCLWSRWGIPAWNYTFLGIWIWESDFFWWTLCPCLPLPKLHTNTSYRFHDMDLGMFFRTVPVGKVGGVFLILWPWWRVF